LFLKIDFVFRILKPEERWEGETKKTGGIQEAQGFRDSLLPSVPHVLLPVKVLKISFF